MKTISSLGLAAVLTCALSAIAGEPTTPPAEKAVVVPSTWRPYKELQDVLYYENFEHALTSTEHGKVTADEPAPPGGHVWKLETNQWETFMQVHMALTQARIPQGLNPANIFIQVNLYSDELGTITIKINDQKGDYAREMIIPKIKTWNLITVKLADLKNKEKEKPDPDHTIKELEVHVKQAKGKKEIPKVWVDDILVTVNSNPSDIKPRVMVAEKRRLDMEKQLERDGFTYTMAVNDFLKTAMKPFKNHVKSKRALVFGPTAEQTPIWRDQLKAAAAKAKDAAFIFDPAEDPVASDKAIGGLADMRTLLMYNLQKDPEFVVLSVSVEDAIAAGRPSESLRVAILRALESGTVPIVCIPAPAKAEDKEKLAAFVKTMEGLCAQLGVPLVDGSFGLKNAKGEFDPAKMGAPAAEKLMQLTVAAIKHVHDSMIKE